MQYVLSEMKLRVNLFDFLCSSSETLRVRSSILTTLSVCSAQTAVNGLCHQTPTHEEYHDELIVHMLSMTMSAVREDFKTKPRRRTLCSAAVVATLSFDE